MAIAFDNTGTQYTAGMTSQTFSFTITGSDTFLFVGNGFDNNSNIVTVTYDGASLTQIGSNQNVDTSRTMCAHGSTGVTLSTGANNLVSNYSISTNARHRASSFTGVSQSSQPEASSSGTVSAATSITGTVTTVTNNAWTIMAVSNDQGALVAGSGTTMRGSSDGQNNFDSNAAITPAGGSSLIAEWTISGKAAQVICAVAPSAVDAFTINTNDQINLTDVPTILIPEMFVSLSDQLNLSENITITNTQLGNLDISDQLNISEDITISNATLADIIVSDQANLTEYTYVSLGLNIDDTLNLTEDITVESSQLGNINVSDQLTISESLPITLTSDVIISDNITLTDVPSITSNLGDINISDQTNISENVAIASFMDISTSDQSNISENISMSGILIDISLSDTLNLSDSLIGLEVLFSISASDQINISENLGKQSYIYISLSDSLTMTESTTTESFRFSPSVETPRGGLTSYLKTPRGGLGYSM